MSPVSLCPSCSYLLLKSLGVLLMSKDKNALKWVFGNDLLYI